MKKLLWLSSIVVFTILISNSCKVKKQDTIKEEVVETDKRVNSDPANQNEMGKVHQPGVMNQAELDSIKLEQRKLKRGIK